MCCLNRPTSRRVALKLGDAERVKTVAFGGDVQVRSAQGGVVWLSRGPLPGGAGERLPAGGLEEEDATHVVARAGRRRGPEAGGRARRGRARGVGRRRLSRGGAAAVAGRGLTSVQVPPDAAPLDAVLGAPRAGAAADPEDARRAHYAAAVDAARAAANNPDSGAASRTAPKTGSSGPSSRNVEFLCDFMFSPGEIMASRTTTQRIGAPRRATSPQRRPSRSFLAASAMGQARVCAEFIFCQNRRPGRVLRQTMTTIQHPFAKWRQRASSRDEPPRLHS